MKNTLDVFKICVSLPSNNHINNNIMAETTKRPRPLYEIAREIKKDWKDVNFAAEPYLEAMSTLCKMEDMFLNDSAKTIVEYFLSNAYSWEGEKADKIKKELEEMIK